MWGKGFIIIIIVVGVVVYSTYEIKRKKGREGELLSVGRDCCKMEGMEREERDRERQREKENAQERDTHNEVSHKQRQGQDD